jgi:tannase/feruloyl esterase
VARFLLSACVYSAVIAPSLALQFGGAGNWRIVAAQDTIARPLTAAQNAPGASPPSFEAQKCTALTDLNLETAPGGPAFITSVQLIDIPATGLERPAYAPSGYGSTNGLIQSGRAHQFCDVTGYVAPQNRFELKLPLRGDWNQNFFFTACGGFCGSFVGERCNFALARSYASATGNGGHESSGNGFDAIWGANAPNLQEDFGWRSNHIVTLIAKAITSHYYGKQIKYSYMAGNSKGGQGLLMEAQRFPEDFDGLMPSAPVYDYTGRNVIAAAWFAQAISDGHGGSVLNAAAAQAVHKSVLAQCGAQAGVEEGLVTDPPACKWKPEMIACASGGDGPDCLSAKELAAVKRLMTPVTNSKGEVLWAYPYLPGAETQWVGWNFLGSPSAGLRPRVANLYLPEQYLKYLVDETTRENVDPLKFDFDRDPAALGKGQEDLRCILLWFDTNIKSSSG